MYGATPGVMADPKVLAGKPGIAVYFEKRHQLFPSLMTLAFFALFGYPIVAGVSLALDPTVAYFIGRWGFMVLAIPFLIFIGHAAHEKYQRPRFWAVMGSTVLPALIVIAVAYAHVLPLGHLNAVLVSQDCTSYPLKFKLQNAYEAAAALFGQCATRVAGATNSTPTSAAMLLDVTDCVEYRVSQLHQVYDEQWALLGKLEQAQGCSGFCIPGQIGLWSRQPSAGDTCAVVAATSIKTVAKTLAFRMLGTGLGILVFAALMIFGLNEIIVKKLGKSW